MIIRLLKNSKKSYFHRVPQNPNPNSHAAYLLLKLQYQKLDPDIKFRRLGHRFWLTFRNRILNKFKKQQKGNLTCVYCGQKHLVTNFNAPKVPKRKKATLDHIIPRAKGGSEISLSNLVVACSVCNQKKADSVPAQKKS